MKLNFWQMLGVVLIVLAGIYFVWDKFIRTPTTTPAPTTVPAVSV